MPPKTQLHQPNLQLTSTTDEDLRPVTHAEVKNLLKWPLRNIATAIMVLSAILAFLTWTWSKYTESARQEVASVKAELSHRIDILEEQNKTIIQLVSHRGIADGPAPAN